MGYIDKEQMSRLAAPIVKSGYGGVPFEGD